MEAIDSIYDLDDTIVISNSTKKRRLLQGKLEQTGMQMGQKVLK